MKKPLLTALTVALMLLQAQMVTWTQGSGERRQPEISGTTQGNTGCAVLEKHTPVKGKLLLAGVVYARTEYVVLDSFNCKLPKEKYTGPGDVKDLNQYAIDNKVKLVVIARNYTDQERDDAKNVCQGKGGLTTPASPAAGAPHSDGESHP